MTETDRLQLSLSRFDHYFDSVNNKTSVFIAITTFITSGVIAIYSKIEIEDFLVLYKVTVGAAIFLGLIILMILIWSLKPFLSKGIESLIYFQGIAKFNYEEFSDISVRRNCDDETNDLRRQVHVLSLGLLKKFKTLRTASVLMIIQVIIISIISLIIILNIK